MLVSHAYLVKQHIWHGKSTPMQRKAYGVCVRWHWTCWLRNSARKARWAQTFAGSDDKVEFMKECGADIAFSYKTTSTKDVLEKEGPIDGSWDNVGGEALDLALENASVGARNAV